ncbi:hypothetical protein T484DRAFT_1909344 [Baffinella frigidus]|nr:hypothetical protein T484DRAFT_1909344 [Cryptophyta sp. CCMP2293]
MAPSSPTNNASTRKPSHLNVTIDGIHKSDTRNHIRAMRLSPHGFSDEWAPATEMGQDSGSTLDQHLSSVECPEDICKLSDDEWDLDEACWSEDDGCASTNESADDTSPANGTDYSLEDTASPCENVWDEADDFECPDENAELLQLLGIDPAASSDIEDAACMWAPQSDGF